MPEDHLFSWDCKCAECFLEGMARNRHLEPACRSGDSLRIIDWVECCERLCAEWEQMNEDSNWNPLIRNTYGQCAAQLRAEIGKHSTAAISGGDRKD